MGEWVCTVARTVCLLWICLAQIGEADRRCSTGELVLTSVNYLDCRNREAEKLTIQSGTIYASRTQQHGSRYSVCDFLKQLRSYCLPLYSRCLRDNMLEAVKQMWVRQELRDTQLYASHGELLYCHGIRDILSRDEVDDAKEMIQANDWDTDSKYCRYNMDYEVTSDRPILWLYSILRCDGSCDPERRLSIPYRVSPRNPNPPKAYRKMRRVVNFHDRGYLNREMNYTVLDYQECLDSLDPVITVREQTREMQPWYAERRGCAVLERYINRCVRILGRCLQPGTIEVVLARDAGQLIITVEDAVRRMTGTDRFTHTSCKVFGGDIDGDGVSGIHVKMTFVVILQLLVVYVW